MTNTKKKSHTFCVSPSGWAPGFKTTASSEVYDVEVASQKTDNIRRRKIKRLLIFISALVLLSSTCFASMTAEYLTSMSIGGITLDSSEEYVRSIYGAPDRIEYDRNLNGTNREGSTAYTYIYE